MAEVRGAGGTPGGLAEFLIGLVMAVGGAYMLTSRVTVHGGYWDFWGRNAFGVALIPFLFGIGFLFFNGRSILGWLLVIAGSTVIFAGILMNLEIYFERTSLFATLVMLVLLVGGIGLIARAVRAHGPPGGTG